MKVMIVVTHLLGTGHLARALVLGRAFADAGHAVTVVSGGMPAPHLASGDIDLLQLPPLRSDGVNFTRLLDADGAVASEQILQARCQILLTQARQNSPDAIITELFPFGRRILTAEFRALLETARGLPERPVICASIRDILAPPSKPEKAGVADCLIETFYDKVLVHSDPTITPLEASWPVSEALEQKLAYTGFVAAPPAGADPTAAGKDQILVTTGGGNVGQSVFETALKAAAKSPTKNWCLLVAGSTANKRIAGLRAKAPPNATVVKASPRFRQMLYHAAASVSLCGYNTAIDILQAGTPAVFVPFDDGGEVEQTLRAETLARLPSIDVLKTSHLTPKALLNHLDRVLSDPKRPPSTSGQRGALRTVEIVSALVSERAG